MPGDDDDNLSKKQALAVAPLCDVASLVKLKPFFFKKKTVEYGFIGYFVIVSVKFARKNLEAIHMFSCL
jgi:hypothetical protein